MVLDHVSGQRRPRPTTIADYVGLVATHHQEQTHGHSSPSAPPLSSLQDQDVPPLLRLAQRTWRRAGVLPADRRHLGAELHGELIAASEAGQKASTVLGDNPIPTLRQWAPEQNVSGQASRTGVLVPLTLLSVLIGSSVLITAEVITIVVPGAPFTSHGAIWLAVLLNSSVVSWLLAPLSCWAVLHRGGDPRAASTARWLFALLPVGAFSAFLIDIMIATLSGTEGPFIQVMAIATAATFTATPITARHLDQRHTRRSPTP